MTAEGVVSIAVVHGKQKIVKLQAKWKQKRLSEISRKPFVDEFRNPQIYAFAYNIMIRTYGAYRCFATIMIKFAVRQLCKHTGSLALIIS